MTKTSSFTLLESDAEGNLQALVILLAFTLRLESEVVHHKSTADEKLRSERLRTDFAGPPPYIIITA